jgi:hypothetical protein
LDEVVLDARIHLLAFVNVGALRLQAAHAENGAGKYRYRITFHHFSFE